MNDTTERDHYYGNMIPMEMNLKKLKLLKEITLIIWETETNDKRKKEKHLS
jgi:hypothetical protein